MLRLEEIGYNKIERRKFHNMICAEDTFSPSDKEGLVIKLRPHHSEPFLEPRRSRGQSLNHGEAKEILGKSKVLWSYSQWKTSFSQPLDTQS